MAIELGTVVSRDAQPTLDQMELVARRGWSPDGRPMGFSRDGVVLPSPTEPRER